MASVMTTDDLLAYNSGNALDMNKLMGGAARSTSDLGTSIFGDQDHQEIDKSLGAGNTIKLHEQYGGRGTKSSVKSSVKYGKKSGVKKTGVRKSKRTGSKKKTVKRKRSMKNKSVKKSKTVSPTVGGSKGKKCKGKNKYT
jgi:hypothetical protein